MTSAEALRPPASVEPAGTTGCSQSGSTPTTQPRPPRSAITVMAVLAAAALAACSAPSPRVAGGADVTEASQLAGGTMLHQTLGAPLLDLPLTDQHGRSFTLGSLEGTTVVITDFLTTCQEVCAMTSANMHDVARDVAAAGLSSSITILELTVDPERDDPARLASYEELYGAQPGWVLATAGGAGTSTLWQSLHIGYKKTRVDAPFPKDWLTGKPLTYDVSHQDVVEIIDPTGHLRWLTIGTPSVSDPLPSRLKSFLNEEGQSNLAAPPDPTWTVRDVDTALGVLTGHRLGL